MKLLPQLDLEKIASGLLTVIDTLILAKISALAIIFSAIFIVSQLVNTRYSAEFTNYFVESNLFRGSLLAAILIISIDLVLLVLLPGLNQWASIGVGFLSILLFVVFSGLIYYFVSRFLLKLKPDTLLEGFSNDLSTTSYIRQADQANKENSLNLHPLQPIYDTARNSLDRGELHVAQMSEDHMRDICVRVVEEGITSKLDLISVDEKENRDTTIQQQKINILFETPFDNYFSTLSQLATDGGQRSLSKRPVESISTIGQVGVSKGCGELAERAFYSTYNENVISIEEGVDQSSANFARLLSATKGCMDILHSTVENDDLELYCQLNCVSYELLRSIDAIVEIDVFQDYHPGNAILEAQIDCYRDLVSNYERTYQEEDLDIKDILGQDSRMLIKLIGGGYYGYEHSDPRISALITCRELFFATTSQILYGSRWLDDETVIPHGINQHWRELIEIATQHPPRSNAILIIQRYIEMVVYHDMEEDIDLLSNSIAEIQTFMRDYDAGIVKEAFEQIYREGDRDYDILDYSSYRGLGRHISWTGLPLYDYSDKFTEKARELHHDAKIRHSNWKESKAHEARISYIDMKNQGYKLPPPDEYRRRSGSPYVLA